MRLASIKLISGEEILAEIVDYIEEKSRKEYKLSPWILLNKTEIHEINIKNIIGMSSVKETEIVEEYGSYFSKKLNPGPKLKQKIPRHEEFKDEYGYVGSVKEFRERLERLYKMDPTDH